MVDEFVSGVAAGAGGRSQMAERTDGSVDQPGDQGDRIGHPVDDPGGAGFERDQAAEERDRAAEKRDRAAEFSEALSVVGNSQAALSRSAMARRSAASDRKRASQDRAAGAREREDASLDALTGVFLRGAGMAQLEREIARAWRTQQPLVVAFVDVDGLKGINDARGHAAGDRMLVDVANTLGRHLRPYDLVIRYGGDEFVCAISGLTAIEGIERFRFVNRVLAEVGEHGSVTVGIAELRREDSVEDLVVRADASLYRERQRQRASPADAS